MRLYFGLTTFRLSVKRLALNLKIIKLIIRNDPFRTIVRSSADLQLRGVLSGEDHVPSLILGSLLLLPSVKHRQGISVTGWREENAVDG